jgi:hypothetical protein
VIDDFQAKVVVKPQASFTRSGSTIFTAAGNLNGGVVGGCGRRIE